MMGSVLVVGDMFKEVTEKTLLMLEHRGEVKLGKIFQETPQKK